MRTLEPLRSAAGEAVTKIAGEQVASLYRLPPKPGSTAYRMVKGDDGLIRFEKV